LELLGGKMGKLQRISQVFETAEQIPFDDSSKIVLMSDCHRGDGSWADEFLKNQNLYFAALNYYYNEKYTYIEIGDGDELWENNKLSDIINTHSDAFWMLSKFYNAGRLYMIFGNHDIVKKNNKFVKSDLYQYFDEQEKKYIALFQNMKTHEGLILKHRYTSDKIFLIHGHQADYFNDKMWRLTRFIVTYLRKPLELFGMNDFTSAAKNYKKKKSIERKLIEWVKREKNMLIAGHTHRPVFPEVGEPLYFNDGSSVHPRCITAIEIAAGSIILAKWSVKIRNDSTLFIGREVLAGPRKLKDYFNGV
jgi:UDP-2,3-diacylglucosamine pyrophosphatase LpxH